MSRPIKIVLKILAATLLLALACAATFYLHPLWVNDHLTAFKLSRRGVSSRFVQVDGYRIHYLESGHSGTPLLLIHGLGARAEVWGALIPTLTAQGFHVYAIDLLGFGRSAQPDVDYSMALQEKTVADFLQALSIPRADVAGWSMGGWVALKLALDHPESVDRLILLDSAGTYFPPTFDASLFAPTTPAGLAVLTARMSPIHKVPLPAFVTRDVLAFLHRNGWVIRRAMDSMEQGSDLVDFRLHDIRQPTLIVWGGADQIIPPEVGETMHRQIPGSTLLIVPNCGHLAAAECSQPILKSALSFLKAGPATP